MDKLLEQMLKFIPSPAVRKHIFTAYCDGEFSPSAEGMLSIVYNSESSFSEKYQFIRSLSEHITQKEAYNGLCTAMELALSNYGKNGLYLSVISWDDEEENEKVIFSSLQEAMAYREENGLSYLNCELCRGDEMIVPEIVIDKGGITELRTTPYGENYSRMSSDYSEADKLSDRYVHVPVPFIKGDVVCYYFDRSEKFIVVNADMPKPELFHLLDTVDMSVMVVPYKYRDNITEDIISIHHEHLYTLTLDYAD